MNKAFVLILLALISCTKSAKDSADAEAISDQNSTADDFKEYISLLPQINLPFETSYEKCCTYPTLDDNNELISKFKPPGESIIGLIEKTNERIIILSTLAADNIIPTVRVYNVEGKLLGTETFMTHYCGGEPGFYEKQYFRINPDISLTEIDTSYNLSIDSITYETIDTIKIDIKSSSYSINNKGEIIVNSMKP
jgi:hypothetical protein